MQAKIWQIGGVSAGMDTGILVDHWPHEANFRLPARASAIGQFRNSLHANAEVRRVAPVSVIIPTFHNQELKRNSLSRCLSGISASTAVKELVVALADQTEHGALLDGLSSVELPKRVLCAPPNNRGAARNIGARAATERYLLFLDDDVVLLNWRSIDVIVSHMEDANFELATFPRRQYLRFPTLYDEAKLSESLAAWRRGDLEALGDRLIDPIASGSSYKTVVFCFPGCFMIVLREVFFRLGGFACNYLGWGYEDADFALRAARMSRVLNLFPRSDPVLHIDHPTSPYKSDEHKENYTLFSAQHQLLQLDLLCDSVLAGRDFSAGDHISAEDRLGSCMEQVSRAFSLPLCAEPIRRSYSRVLEDRLRRGYHKDPLYVLLHGSRARGDSSWDSDFDILVLFDDGPGSEFVSCIAEGAALEVEFSDTVRYQSIAESPWLHPMSSVLELAKLQTSILLWGDPTSWTGFRDRLISAGRARGRMLWSVLAIGMSLTLSKYQGFYDRFAQALACLFGQDDRLCWPHFPGRAGLADRKGLAIVAAELDEEYPLWRERTVRGDPIFDQQPPEAWRALIWMCKTK